MTDVALTILIVMLSVWFLIIDVNILYRYQSEDDADRTDPASIYSKLIILLGLQWYWTQTLTLPIDGYNATPPLNRPSPGVDMSLLYTVDAVYVLIHYAFLNKIAIAFQNKHPDDTTKKTIAKLAFKIFLSVGFIAAFAGLAYYLLSSIAIKVPATVCKRCIASNTFQDRIVLSNNSAGFAYGNPATLELCRPFANANPETLGAQIITISLSFAQTLFIGIIVFSTLITLPLVGFGLIELPYVLISQYVNRPSARTVIGFK